MARSSRTVTVSKHDPSCAVLAAGDCNCAPEVTVERYVRVCAVCGGGLRDQRFTYCSSRCKHDNRVRGKNRAARLLSDDEWRARKVTDP